MKTIAHSNIKQLGLACASLGLLAGPMSAATIFMGDPNATAVAKWETWEWTTEDEAFQVGRTGSQGSAQEWSGGIGETEVETEIVFPVNGFAGVLAGGDLFYIGDGGFKWTMDAAFTTDIDYVRVSYSLATDERGELVPFGNAPSLDIAIKETDKRSGNYRAGETHVFFTEFKLPEGVSGLVATFGDDAMGTHHALDAIQIEGFSGTVPSVIPEPSTYALGAGIGILGLALLRRRFGRR